jgi:hypothetical protein
MRWVWTLLFAAAGCNFTGGLHREEERQVVVEASYGHADPTEPFLWQGDGDGDNLGLMVGYAYYWRDRVGLQAKLTPVRMYDQADGDAYLAEFQIGFRYYFWELEDFGVFLEALGGISYAHHSVPAVNGTHYNFTQDTGLGVEYLIDDRWSVLGGYRYSHLSNGQGVDQTKNPSQNDHEWWLGVGYSW